MKKIVFLSILVIIGLLFAGQIKRGFLSFFILIDSARPQEKAMMGKFISPPAVKTVTVSSRGGTLRADLYTPHSGGLRKGLLLVHGLDPAGNRNERFVLFATDLARAGFLVLAPDLRGLRNFRVRLSDTEDMVQSFLYLMKLKNAKPGGTMVAFSLGAGPMVLAAADPRIRDRVRTILSLGGYGDFRTVIQFMITGYYDYGGNRGYLRPETSLRWMFLYKNLDLVRTKNDRELLGKIIKKRNQFQYADEKKIVEAMGDEGRAVYAFFANTEQKKFVMLYEKLPLAFREYFIQLSPLRVMKQVKAYCIIVHSMEDYTIPYSESVKLTDAVADRERSHLTLLPHSVYTVPEPTNMSTYGAFVSYFRMFGAMYALLSRSE